MNKLIATLVLTLLFTATANAATSEVVKEAAEAKTMYKELKNVLGDVCSDSRCLVTAGFVNCTQITGVAGESVCTIANRHDGTQVYSVLGRSARSLFESLVEFQEPVCQGITCMSAVLSMECTAYGYLFPDYLCRAEVLE